jgi:hypothetical protein
MELKEKYKLLNMIMEEKKRLLDEVPKELIEIGIETPQQFDKIIKDVIKCKSK